MRRKSKTNRSGHSEMLKYRSRFSFVMEGQRTPSVLGAGVLCVGCAALVVWHAGRKWRWRELLLCVCVTCAVWIALVLFLRWGAGVGTYHRTIAPAAPADLCLSMESARGDRQLIVHLVATSTPYDPLLSPLVVLYSPLFHPLKGVLEDRSESLHVVAVSSLDGFKRNPATPYRVMYKVAAELPTVVDGSSWKHWFSHGDDETITTTVRDVVETALKYRKATGLPDNVTVRTLLDVLLNMKKRAMNISAIGEYVFLACLLNGTPHPRELCLALPTPLAVHTMHLLLTHLEWKLAQDPCPFVR
jgi:hypothetical protein